MTIALVDVPVEPAGFYNLAPAVAATARMKIGLVQAMCPAEAPQASSQASEELDGETAGFPVSRHTTSAAIAAPLSWGSMY